MGAGWEITKTDQNSWGKETEGKQMSNIKVRRKEVVSSYARVHAAEKITKSPLKMRKEAEKQKRIMTNNCWRMKTSPAARKKGRMVCSPLNNISESGKPW